MDEEVYDLTGCNKIQSREDRFFYNGLQILYGQLELAKKEHIVEGIKNFIANHIYEDLFELLNKTGNELSKLIPYHITNIILATPLKFFTSNYSLYTTLQDQTLNRHQPQRRNKHPDLYVSDAPFFYIRRQYGRNDQEYILACNCQIVVRIDKKYNPLNPIIRCIKQIVKFEGILIGGQLVLVSDDLKSSQRFKVVKNDSILIDVLKEIRLEGESMPPNSPIVENPIESTSSASMGRLMEKLILPPVLKKKTISEAMLTTELNPIASRAKGGNEESDLEEIEKGMTDLRVDLNKKSDFSEDTIEEKHEEDMQHKDDKVSDKIASEIFSLLAEGDETSSSAVVQKKEELFASLEDEENTTKDLQAPTTEETELKSDSTQRKKNKKKKKPKVKPLLFNLTANERSVIEDTSSKLLEKKNHFPPGNDDISQISSNLPIINEMIAYVESLFITADRFVPVIVECTQSLESNEAELSANDYEFKSTNSIERKLALKTILVDLSNKSMDLENDILNLKETLKFLTTKIEGLTFELDLGASIEGDLIIETVSDILNIISSFFQYRNDSIKNLYAKGKTLIGLYLVQNAKFLDTLKGYVGACSDYINLSAELIRIEKSVANIKKKQPKAVPALELRIQSTRDRKNQAVLELIEATKKMGIIAILSDEATRFANSEAYDVRSPIAIIQRQLEKGANSLTKLVTQL